MLLSEELHRSERAVIGSMLRHNPCISDVLVILEHGGWFYSDACQKLFAVIKDLWVIIATETRGAALGLAAGIVVAAVLLAYGNRHNQQVMRASVLV